MEHKVSSALRYQLWSSV